jgi:hypothetical protein
MHFFALVRSAYTDKDTEFFKLKPAFGAAFAEICESYFDAVHDDCSDTPSETPIFSWLSPHQRLELVYQVIA